MKVASNVSLKAYNTFGIKAKAKKFIEVSSINEAIEQFKTIENNPMLILGGGSNILLTKDFDGIVIKNNIKGIEKVHETETEIELKIGAGENWHQFVCYCVEHAYYGIENLSLIPGYVGASPMQNIGAYGVEVKDVIKSVEAVEIKTGMLRVFTKDECEFDYRSSIFKTSHKGQFFITSVNFILSKIPKFKIEYGAIKDQLLQDGINLNNLSIKAVSQAVISIRKSKLPDPKEIGNSGSFFKNPVVSKKQYLKLKASYPSMPAYELPNSQYKIAAGWMIETDGWKGFREGDYGVHAKQALVLVNYDEATGNELYQLSERIIQSIQKRFDILLEREVNII
tara:strand:- start:166 stop:1182 length:1017 start_codon:yes stop_codon:yes gene_type:complete